MRDFLPEAKARRERALTTIRQVYSQHGFDEIETPVMEDFDRLHSWVVTTKSSRSACCAGGLSLTNLLRRRHQAQLKHLLIWGCGLT
jgi:elongation factor P--beta-lysine ligase